MAHETFPDSVFWSKEFGDEVTLEQTVRLESLRLGTWLSGQSGVDPVALAKKFEKYLKTGE